MHTQFGQVGTPIRLNCHGASNLCEDSCHRIPLNGFGRLLLPGALSLTSEHSVAWQRQAGTSPETHRNTAIEHCVCVSSTTAGSPSSTVPFNEHTALLHSALVRASGERFSCSLNFAHCLFLSSFMSSLSLSLSKIFWWCV